MMGVVLEFKLLDQERAQEQAVPTRGILESENYLVVAKQEARCSYNSMGIIVFLREDVSVIISKTERTVVVAFVAIERLRFCLLKSNPKFSVGLPRNLLIVMGKVFSIKTTELRIAIGWKVDVVIFGT